MLILCCYFFLPAAAFLDAGILLLKDSTVAMVSIADTSGCFVVVKHRGEGIKIDKKLIRYAIAGKDTLVFTVGKCQDTCAAAPGGPLSVDNAIKPILSGRPVKKTVLSRGCGIAYQKQPVTGKGSNEKTNAAFSNRMASFLSKHGPLRRLSKAGMYFFLSGDTSLNNGCRYLALPADITVRSKERRLNISSFVKLDTAGNFVPTAKAATLSALERETTVRFMVLDLQKKTIVFDERVKDVDKGLKELVPGKSNDIKTGSGENSILVIERKIEALLKKQFK